MTNRRRHKRFIKRCDIEFMSEGLKFTGIASDFSLNGMFIRTKYPKAPYTVLDAVLHLPNGVISQLRVRVKRAWKTSSGRVIKTPIKIGKNGMGVEILEKDTAYLHLIRYLLWRTSALKRLPRVLSMVGSDDA